MCNIKNLFAVLILSIFLATSCGNKSDEKTKNDLKKSPAPQAEVKNTPAPKAKTSAVVKKEVPKLDPEVAKAKAAARKIAQEKWNEAKKTRNAKRALLAKEAVVALDKLVVPDDYKGGPKIQFDTTTHDFGTVEQATKNDHVFKFKNIGDEDLEIIKVRPTCGCTAALLSAKVIKPGESGEIKVTFNAGSFRGKINKTVYVETNEPILKNKRDEVLIYMKSKSISTPVMPRPLHFSAQVTFTEEKDSAINKALREREMRRSKEKKEHGAK